MKKFYFSLIAMVGALMPLAVNAQTLVQKNVYAYDIVVTQDAVNKNVATVEYKLNGLTKEVTIQALVDGTAVETVEGTTNYTNSVEVTIPSDKTGKVTFEITAVPEGTVDDVTVVANSPQYYSFWSPTTIAVNTDPNSPTFGRVLTVENRYHNTPFTNAGYYACGRGGAVYAFDPIFAPVLAKDGNPGFTLGLGENNDSKTQVYGDYQDLRYTKDGRLFLSSGDPKKYGLYELDPDDLDATAHPLFESTDKNIWAFDVYANGDGTYKIIAIVSSSNTDGTGSAGIAGNAAIYAYDMDENGNITGGEEKLITSITNNWVNGLNMKVAIDPTGTGFYASQHRGANSEAEPHLLHADMNGENIDNDYTTVINGGGMGYNHDGTLFARGEGAQTVCVYRVNNLPAGLTPEMEKVATFNAGIGNAIMAVGFDYANNLFVSSNSGEKLQQYQLPASIAGDYTTVPSPESMAFVIEGTTGVNNVAVEATNGEAVHYNLNGVRMQGELPAGVYVKVVDGKATKVVVK
ncbi:MAG: hypothetical protein J1F20_04440 [Muribaculaceae bacterium]|nr:hypothetical protein [Muribaculaceae bacterium]